MNLHGISEAVVHRWWYDRLGHTLGIVHVYFVKLVKKSVIYF